MIPADLEAELETLHAASFAWAMACCGRRREVAEDVLQTSYLKLLDGRARFAGRSSFKSFLFGVIRRTASELRRQRLVRELVLARWDRSRLAPADPPPLPSEAATTLAALRRLARRQREMLELVFEHDLTVAEAAEVLGISLGSGRVHYERGKRRLRHLLARSG